MNWETLIIIVAQIIISLVLFFLIKNYYPAYFTEKGKNVATKEDIEEITEKIKTVESKINIKANSEIDYNSLKRKIIFDYFGAYNHWEQIVTVSRSHDGVDCEFKNDSLIEKINEARFNYNLKEGDLEIFISDPIFDKLTTNINLSILEQQHIFEMHCFDINIIVKSESNLPTRYNKMSECSAKLYQKRIEKVEELKKNRKELIAYLENALKQSFN